MHPTIRELLGRNVQARRTALGLSQSEFIADKLGAFDSKRTWTVNAVSEFETGKRAWTADDVVLFARALGVRPGDLFEIPAAVDGVEIRGEMVPRTSIQPETAVVPYQTLVQLTRALDGHREQIRALEESVGDTYADLLGVRKTWLRQNGRQPQPREEDE